MSGISLSEFRTGLKDIARPNRFIVDLAGLEQGTTIAPTENMEYYVKSIDTNQISMQPAVLNRLGFQFKVPGDITFENMTLTVLVDRDFNSINFFNKILDKYRNFKSGVRIDASQAQLSSMSIYALGYDGSKKLALKLNNVIVSDITSIGFAQDSNDSPLEATITVHYFNTNSAGWV